MYAHALVCVCPMYTDRCVKFQIETPTYAEKAARNATGDF